MNHKRSMSREEKLRWMEVAMRGGHVPMNKWRKVRRRRHLWASIVASRLEQSSFLPNEKSFWDEDTPFLYGGKPTTESPEKK